MKSKIKSTERARLATMIEDAIGALSLFVLLFAGLGLTGPF